eukprot:snap_masked-scaffold_6-processed-gene-7.18-mRNA-1 protein AED:1.00 eAED:1.00 QI:0/0/0/0/1/1/2/0/545
MTRYSKSFFLFVLSIFGLRSAGKFSQEEFDAHCFELINNDSLNWRDGALETDQEIVSCLRESLGDPIGFGEGTTGGYDPEGSSELIIITNDFPEQQVVNAIENPNYTWIVFDKIDFAEEVMLSMHRMNCTDSIVLSGLGNSSVEECMDPFLWCNNKVVDAENCIHQFYNVGLNVDSPVTTLMMDTNTAIDGRGSKAYFMFNGFKVGMDSLEKGNVIITNVHFKGAGHIENHENDPDMIRVTGQSSRVWIHQNTFEESGDGAVELKRGGRGTTVSFNKFLNVYRSSIHGSSDSQEINEIITSTYHNNLFITTDRNFSSKFYQSARRVPLLRRGQSHSWNNDIGSIRVGGRLYFENNLVLIQEDFLVFKNRTLNRFTVAEDMFDFKEGGVEVVDSIVSLVDENCNPTGVALNFNGSMGTTPDMLSQYGNYSKDMYYENIRAADVDLVKYLKQTTGKGAFVPFMSPYALDTNFLIETESGSCLERVPQDEGDIVLVFAAFIILVTLFIVIAVIFANKCGNIYVKKTKEGKLTKKDGDILVMADNNLSI